MGTPSITAAQVVAIVGSIIAVAVSFGAPITPDQRESLVDLVTILAPILIVGDAAIRFGRASNADKIARSKQIDSVGKPDEPEGPSVPTTWDSQV